MKTDGMAWRSILCLLVALASVARSQDAGDTPPARPAPRRAPDLEPGLEWFNTEQPLGLRDLRGKFVLLDFWTYCCINCMHILPELARLEAAYPDEIVVIGVHSAKFDEEKLDANIRAAILRHRIRHPVVNDADHRIWDAYGVSSWPSLRVIDPEGNLIAGESGEVTFEQLRDFFERAIPRYREAGLLDERPLRFSGEALVSPGPLRFPGKVFYDEPGDRLFIADTGNDRILVARVDDSDGRLVARVETRIGSGATGAADGDFGHATFNQPQGLALSDGDTLWIADTENHLVRQADLRTGVVRTVAGTGAQARGPWPGTRLDRRAGRLVPTRRDGRFVGPPLETPLNSPWDCVVQDGLLFIAMAGPHQIWRMPLDASEIGPFAGNGREDVVDGPLLPATPFATGASSFAQPSGLAGDGRLLYVADSEGSSIRIVPLSGEGTVRTLVGTAALESARLFTFGDVDGSAEAARLQHPLGVALHGGSLFVADTYNNKIRVVDVRSGAVRTLAGSGEAGSGDDPAEFDEPGGIAFGAGVLWLADTNNHLVRVIDPADGAVNTLEILPPPGGWRAAGSSGQVAGGDAGRGRDLGLPQSVVKEAGRPAPAMPPLPPAADDATEAGAGSPRLERPAGPPAVVPPVRLAPRTTKRGREATLAMAVAPPAGWKLNDLVPLRYELDLEGDAGPVDPGPLRRVFAIEKPTGRFVVELPVRELPVREGPQASAKLIVIVECGICSIEEGECRPVTAAFAIPLSIGPHAVGPLAVDAEADREVVRLPLKIGAGSTIPGLDLFD
jgi:thiol-disulfide isomerase/thioredoxin